MANLFPLMPAHLRPAFERLVSTSYTSTQVDGTDEVVGLSELYWNYIQSDAFEALERNRAGLKNALQPDDRAYIEKTWQPKESRVVYAYTRLYPNLGATSSQRGESYHYVMKQVTNGQLSLERSCQRLVRKILDILRELLWTRIGH
jgi:hypothetical protein